MIADPFSHIRLDNWLGDELSEQTLSWLETDAPWRLRVASFYEQYEFSLLERAVSPIAVSLVSKQMVSRAVSMFHDSFDAGNLELVDVTAHLLCAGQTIRIHNDFVGSSESHRLLVQLNRGWKVANGGLLMLFGSQETDDVRAVIVPEHKSAFAFAISPKSFHAVSTVASGKRFTLVYTFRKVDAIASDRSNC